MLILRLLGVASDLLLKVIARYFPRLLFLGCVYLLMLSLAPHYNDSLSIRKRVICGPLEELGHDFGGRGVPLKC